MHIIMELISNDKIILPLYHNRILQEFVYSLLNDEIISFLVEKGYKSTRSFKLFACSNIISEKQEEAPKNHINYGNRVHIEISFPFNDICTFTNGLRRKHLFLGNNPVNIGSLSIDLQEVTTNYVVVKTLSPVIVYSKPNKPNTRNRIHCLQPGEQDFQRICTDILRKKYTTATKKTAPNEQVHITTITPPRQHIHETKTTLIKSYSSFLGLSGPIPLLQTALDCGLGKDTSLGFGLIRLA